MKKRIKITLAAVLATAVVTSITTASATSDRSPTSTAPSATAAREFGIATHASTGAIDPAMFRAITDMIVRNPGVSAVGAIGDARNVGDAQRGIVGVVAPQRSGGICYEIEQQGTLGTGGCVDSFPARGYAGSHGVVADQFSLMGLVASDVTAMSVEFTTGSAESVTVVNGAYSWTGSVNEAAPVAIRTARDGAVHRDPVDLAGTLAASRAQQAPPTENIIG